MPCWPAKCPNAAAPTAANARWHSEICPERAHQQAERQEQDDVDQGRATRRRREPHAATGTNASSDDATAPAPTPDPAGAYQYERRALHDRAAGAPPARRRGSTIRTTNRTMNGSAGGSPPSQRDRRGVLVGQGAPAMPTSRPPTKVSGRLEKYADRGGAEGREDDGRQGDRRRG